MEIETSNHYVLQTQDNNEENELIIENNTILICSEDGEQTQYVPFAIENGQIILKRVDEIEETTNRLENLESVESATKEENIQNGAISKQQNIMYDSRTTQHRRKLSYETDFKPCSLPSNRGGMKGLIRYGRKHLIIDQKTMISPREFKQQLNDTEDLIMKAEFAPCTKQQMRHVLTGITRLFAYPSHKMPNNKLLQLYVSNCTSKKTPNDENITDMELLPLGYKVEVDASKIKRITRKRRYPEAEEYLRQQSLLKQEKDETEELVLAAKSAETDHKYTNRKEIENVFVEPIENEQQIYIMQSVDENGTLNNIEVLLAAAETTDEELAEYQQIEEINQEIDDSDVQRIYFVQEGTDEVICLPEEYILS